MGLFVLDDPCGLIEDYPVVHLSRRCLQTCAFRYRVPVISIPSRRDGGGLHCSSAHLSFAYGDSSDADVVVAVARNLNWTSAVYVGDNNAGKQKQ